MNRTVDTYEKCTESVESKEGLSTSKFWKKERETKEKIRNKYHRFELQTNQSVASLVASL